MKVQTTVPVGSSRPSSITVSSDGDHLAVAEGATVYGYSGVRAAAVHGRPVTPQTSFSLGTAVDEFVTDVAYTGNDTLVVIHGDGDNPPAWHLTLVKGVPAGHPVVKGALKTVDSRENGTLSVWPAP